MKRILTLLLVLAFTLTASAQKLTDAQRAAAEAAKAITQAPKAETIVEKPKYWQEALKTNLSVGQTGLTNWAAGGDNTFSLQGFIDASANYKKDEMFWNNRLQLDFGILYASSKPLLQKTTDRIYLESKWGYKTQKMNNLHFSASYDFKSQFAKGWEYKTPSVPDEYKDPEGKLPDLDQLSKEEQKKLWKDARVLKSSFLAPANTNLALGIDYTPTPWLGINFAPVTGGFVIVRDAALRKAYSMELKKPYKDLGDNASEEQKHAIENGTAYRNARFEFGAQLKIDIKVNINDNFAYSTQFVFFEDYLKDHKKYPCPRINWDNRFDWKIAKYFSLTLTTNFIYDDMVMIKSDKDLDKFPDGKPRVQFKESLAFGFTYTIATK